MFGRVNVRYHEVMTPTETRRPYRRSARYTARLSMPITSTMREELEQEADREEVPVADVARDAIARGLPLMRDAKRKRRRNGPRKRGGNGGGNGPDAGGA